MWPLFFLNLSFFNWTFTEFRVEFIDLEHTDARRSFKIIDIYLRWTSRKCPYLCFHLKGRPQASIHWFIMSLSNSSTSWKVALVNTSIDKSHHLGEFPSRLSPCRQIYTTRRILWSCSHVRHRTIASNFEWPSMALAELFILGQRTFVIIDHRIDSSRWLGTGIVEFKKTYCSFKFQDSIHLLDPMRRNSESE